MERLESRSQNDHLPDACRAFNARRAWRGWSEVDANVHYAVYEFDDLAAARTIPDSSALKRIVVEFDRAWDGKVTRSRDIVELIRAVGG